MEMWKNLQFTRLQRKETRSRILRSSLQKLLKKWNRAGLTIHLDHHFKFAKCHRFEPMEGNTNTGFDERQVELNHDDAGYQIAKRLRKQMTNETLLRDR